MVDSTKQVRGANFFLSSLLVSRNGGKSNSKAFSIRAGGGGGGYYRTGREREIRSILTGLHRFADPKRDFPRVQRENRSFASSRRGGEEGGGERSLPSFIIFVQFAR